MTIASARVWPLVCCLAGCGGCGGAAKAPADAGFGDVPVIHDGAGTPDSSTTEVVVDGAGAGDTRLVDGGVMPDRPADAAGSVDEDAGSHDAGDGAFDGPADRTSGAERPADANDAGADGPTFGSTAGAGPVRSYDTALWARSGHPAAIYQLDWSRDGATIVTTGSTDGTVRIFDAHSGRLRRLMSTSTSFVYAAALSADGAFVVTGDNGPTARLWDAVSGVGLRTFTGHKNAVAAVAFSPDGATVATGGRGATVVLWSRATGAVQRVLTQPGWIYSLRFSPDGQLLASASDGQLRLWNPTTGEVVRDIPSPMPMPGADATTGLDFSADGSLLLTGSYQHVGRVFKVATGELVTTLSGHTDWVYAVGWNGTGTRAVTASLDGTIRIWDVPGYVQHRMITTTLRTQTAVFNPTADELAAPDLPGGTVRVWDGQTALPLREITGPAGRVYGVAYSPDGTRVASGGQDGRVRLWTAADGAQTASLPAGDWIRAVAWSPTGDRIAAAGHNGVGGIWNAATGDKLAGVPSHGARTLAIAWSPDGNLLATGGSDLTVVLQDLGAGTSRTLTGHTGDVTDLSFSSDGKLLASVSIYREVKIWDTGTGALLHALMGGITGSADAVAFSADGKMLAVAVNQNTGLIQLWDTTTWLPTRQLASSTQIIEALAFSRDGTKLATGAQDQSVRVWTVATGAQSASFTGTMAAVHDVAFAPDGAHVAFGDDLGTLAVIAAQ